MSKNDLEYESSSKVIIESVKDIQLMKHEDRLLKVLNVRNSQSFNNINDKLNIDDKTKNQNYSLVLTLNVPFPSHIISMLLY